MSVGAASLPSLSMGGAWSLGSPWRLSGTESPTAEPSPTSTATPSSEPSASPSSSPSESATASPSPSTSTVAGCGSTGQPPCVTELGPDTTGLLAACLLALVLLSAASLVAHLRR